LELMKMLHFFALMAGQATISFFERGVMKRPEQWQRCIEVQGEYVEKLVLF